MAVSTRVLNNSGLFFSLKLAAASAVVFDDLKTVELSNEAKDDSDLTFSEAASGVGVDWTVAGTAITSFDATSLHTYLFSNPGASVLVTVGYKGNVTPSVDKPHLQLTATISSKPGVSKEAGTDGTGADFDFELKGSTDVTKVTA